MNEQQIKAKVEEILSRMTLEEKAAQMVQVPVAMVGPEESEKWAQRGAGSFLHTLGPPPAEHLHKDPHGHPGGIWHRRHPRPRPQ